MFRVKFFHTHKEAICYGRKNLALALSLLTSYAIASLWASPFPICKVRALDEVTPQRSLPASNTFNSDDITMFPWRVLERLSTLPCPPLLRSSGPPGCYEHVPDSTEMSHSRLAPQQRAVQWDLYLLASPTLQASSCLVRR